MAATFVLQLPVDGALDLALRADPPPSVADGTVALDASPADDHSGRLERPAVGEVVLGLPSPEAIRRQADDVRRALHLAGAGVQPLVIEIKAASELREEELAPLVAAARQADRPVIVRVLGTGERGPCGAGRPPCCSSRSSRRPRWPPAATTARGAARRPRRGPLPPSATATARSTRATGWRSPSAAGRGRGGDARAGRRPAPGGRRRGRAARPARHRLHRRGPAGAPRRPGLRARAALRDARAGRDGRRDRRRRGRHVQRRDGVRRGR